MIFFYTCLYVPIIFLHLLCIILELKCFFLNFSRIFIRVHFKRDHSWIWRKWRRRWEWRRSGWRGEKSILIHYDPLWSILIHFDQLWSIFIHFQTKNTISILRPLLNKMMNPICLTWTLCLPNPSFIEKLLTWQKNIQNSSLNIPTQRSVHTDKVEVFWEGHKNLNKFPSQRKDK